LFGTSQVCGQHQQQRRKYRHEQRITHGVLV
jgi:hypothetical protein